MDYYIEKIIKLKDNIIRSVLDKNNNNKVIQYFEKIIDALSKKEICIDNEFLCNFCKTLLERFDCQTCIHYFCGILDFIVDVHININESLCEHIFKMVYDCCNLEYEFFKYLRIFDNCKLTDESKYILYKTLLTPMRKHDIIKPEFFHIYELINRNIDYIISHNELFRRLIYDDLIVTFKYLIDTEKVILTTELLELVTATEISSQLSSQSVPYEIIKYMISHKVIPNHKCFDNITRHEYYIKNCKDVRKTVNNILDMFLEFEITLTKEDIKSCVKLGLEINNLNYSEFVDDETFRLCVNETFFPKILSNFKPNRESIQYLINNIDLNIVPYFVRKTFYEV